MVLDSESENNIIKHIGKEICKECSGEGAEASQELAEYIVRTKLLNPENGYTSDYVMPRDLTQKLISECVRDLRRTDPETDGIRLQIYWNLNPADFVRVGAERDSLALKNCRSVLKDLLETKFQIQDKDKILKKLSSFVLVYSGVGNPFESLAYKETKAALQSIFKTTNLQSFLVYNPEEKMEALNNLTRIAVGIILYHNRSGLGKQEIEDLPKILSHGVDNLQGKIQDCLRNSETRINYIVDGLKTLSIMNGNSEIGVGSVLANFDKNHLENSKDVLIIMRQYRIYLERLSENVSREKEELIQIQQRLEETFHQLGDTIKNRIAIPTSSVFPLFKELGNLWSRLQITAQYFHRLDSVIKNLNSINKYFEPSQFEKALNILAVIESKKIQAQENRLEKTQEMHPEVLVLKEEDRGDFLIEFNGFCAWTISQTQGIVVPGNPEIGLLQFREKFYTFSSANAARNWAVEPDRHVKKALNAGRMKPALVQLLNIYDYLNKYKKETLVEKALEKKQTAYREIQTELHPVTEYIDQDYTFNIWELKRRALQLSRIVKCETKSLQTVDRSSFRSSIGTQSAPNKDQISQTARDNGSLRPAPSRYVWGLRGRRQEEPHVVNFFSENHF